ncbi:deoxyribose-phosphate aldolase [Thermocatellispora tengchongensis]|uniref:Deoxyribose-phosphate aldolase n=1 Tax=Thermocatellispora tengchongensis TaxID=1073253 RepID=A0A840NV97_9ACTN|nr:deoxyribose-phosphate aldolase [Thermocatellispora tengchongensis]MBB5131458.1 deoxyribose-phosphate aldolase [Thermocatellispora tengchongensis]
MTDGRRESLARRVDISCVQAHHSLADVTELARLAREHDFVSAHVLPQWLGTLAGMLAGSRTLAGAPVGFPSGGATTRTKLAEAGELLEAGAGELDVVIAVGRLRSGDSEYVRRELAQVVALVDGAVPLRAIIEVGHLDDREIGEATRAAVDAGVPWVKTGTGWSGVPTTEHHVRLIAEAARGRAGIKAAGGIRDVATIRAMEALGVARFGMNARAAIAAVAAYDERAEVAR